MSEHPLNTPSRDENGRLYSRTVTNGRKETYILPRHSPQLRSQSTPSRGDENGRLPGTTDNRRKENSLPTNFPPLPRQSTPGPRDENVPFFPAMTGNGQQGISASPTLRRRDENVHWTGTMDSGGDEIPHHTNFLQLRSQSTPSHHDENPIFSDMMGNGRHEISTSPTNSLSLRRHPTASRDENVTPFSGTMGNVWDETSTLPTNTPQLRSRSTPSHHERNVTSFPGAMGNGEEEITFPTNFSQLRLLSTTSRRDDNNVPLSGTVANGGEEISTLRTNSPQISHKSSANDHIQEASFFGIVVSSKMRKRMLSRRLWCLVAMIIAISLGIPIGFALRIRDFSVQSQADSENSTIKLVAILVDIDPRLRTMTIDWVVDNATCHSQPCEIYDIFFDNSLLVSGSRNDLKTSTNNSFSRTPIFSVDSKLMGDDASPLANSPFFTTEISIVSGISTDIANTRSLQSYPFDRYLAGITIFAKNRNDTLHDPDPDNLVPICIIGSAGIAAGFTTKINTSEDTFVNGNYVNLVIDISRGIEVKIYAIVIIIAIWLVTLVVLSATTYAIFLGHKLAKEVLLIPIATLFAFTSLRGTMPSAPQGFGAIMDYIGVLPCLSILTFCAVLHVGTFLIRNPEEDRSDVQKMKLNR